MNGVHDLGGMDGFEPIAREADEPVFHSAWEGRAFAMTLSTMGARCFNTDEFRRTIERMPPVRYLSSSYYERWLHALESLLVEKGIVTPAELQAAMRDQANRGAQVAAPIVPRTRTGARVDESKRPRFRAGDRVLARNINPPGHTRLPRYARGKHGIVRYDWGIFPLPDTLAHGLGRNSQHCYGVEFQARELWGREHTGRERVYLDLWEDYLEADRAAPRKIEKAPAKRIAKSAKPKTAAVKNRNRPKARPESAR